MPRKALGQRQHSCYPKIFQLATRKEGRERPQDIAGYQVLLDQRDAEIARQSAELLARDLLIEKTGDGQTNRPRSNRFENRT